MNEGVQAQAIELLRRAWVTLDVVDPNAPITDEVFEFLAGLNPALIASGTTNDAADWRALEPVMSDE